MYGIYILKQKLSLSVLARKKTLIAKRDNNEGETIGLSYNII
jgi:hypothetical protein